MCARRGLGLSVSHLAGVLPGGGWVHGAPAPSSLEGLVSVGIFCGQKVPGAGADGLTSWALGTPGQEAATARRLLWRPGGTCSPHGHVGAVSVAMAGGAGGTRLRSSSFPARHVGNVQPVT